MPGKVRQGGFRRRVMSEDLEVNNSAPHDLWAQANASDAAKVLRLDPISR